MASIYIKGQENEPFKCVSSFSWGVIEDRLNETQPLPNLDESYQLMDREFVSDCWVYYRV